MANIVFPYPANPGDIFTADNGVVYYYDGTKWIAQGGGGIPGATGATGIGDTGATGATGSDGATGATGTGVQGSTGATGSAGATGPQGSTGPTGATGSSGVQGSTGSTGATGAPGATGSTGPQGATGVQGSAGASGATGSTGPQGSTGATGATGGQGATGTAGSNGATGATGTDGATGATGMGVPGNDGATGATGTPGADGATGLTGATGQDSTVPGATGATGPAGTSVTIIGSVPTVGADPQVTLNAAFPSAVAGDGAIDQNTGDLWVYDGATWNDVGTIQGPQGSTGATGVGIDGATGATGTPGQDGATGATGNPGDVGATGATGQGAPGNDGATGATGIPGLDGATGIDGATGATGMDGATGATGATGVDGATGSTGPDGATGVDGATGASGATGATGNDGATGPDGATGVDGATGSTGVDGATGATGSFTGQLTTNLDGEGYSIGNVASIATGSGTNNVVFQPDPTTAGYTLTLPVDTGSNTQVLTTDGTGVLSWTTPTGGNSNYIVNGTSYANIATPDGNVEINSNGASWSFNTDGSLSLPAGNLVGLGNVIGPGNISYPFGPGPILLANTADGNSSAYFSLTAVANATGVLGYMGMAQFGANSSTGLVETNDDTGVTHDWYFNPDGTTVFPAYTFPNVDGTSGQVLTSYGNALLYWANAGSGGSVYANTVGSFGSDMGIGPNYSGNDPAVLFGEDDVLIRTGGTASSGGQNYGELYLAGSEDAYFGQADNLVDSTYPTFNTSVFANSTAITLAVPGPHTMIMASDGTFTYDGSNILGGGTANTGNVTFNDINIIGTGNLHLQPDPANAAAYLDVYLTTGPDIHIAGNGENVIIGGDTTANVTVNTNGNVTIQSWNGTANTWTFGDNGNLTLPRGGVVYETNIPGGALTGNTIALAPSGGTDPDQQLLVYPTAGGADANHLHLTSGNLLNTELFLGNDDLYVKLANTGNVVIGTYNPTVPGSNLTWTFDNTGNIILPGNTSSINYANGVSILNGISNVSSLVNGSQTLSLNSDGTVTMPLGSVIKATTGSYTGISTSDGNTFAYVDSGGFYVYTLYNTAEYEWHFDNSGNLTLPDVANVSINYANGNPYGGGTANTGNITFNDINIIGTGNLHLQPDSTNASAYLDIYLTYGPDIHIAGNGENVIVGRDDGANVTVNTNGNVTIQSWNGTANTWTFSNDGTFVTPGVSGNITGANNISAVTYTAPGNVQLVAGSSTWVFDTLGSLELPVGGSEFTSITAANAYPELVAYGSGGHGGPEMDWMNADDPANTFNSSSTLRHTMFLNGDGFYIGLNENNVGNVFRGHWQFDTAGNLTLPGAVGFSNSSAVIQSIGPVLQIAGNIQTNQNTLGLPVDGGDTFLSANANVNLQSGIGGTNYEWSFGVDGTLTAPGNVSTTGNVIAGWLYGDGSNISNISGTANTGNITFSNTTISTADTLSNVVIETYDTANSTTNSWTFGSDRELYLPTGGRLGVAGKGWTGLDGGNGAPVSLTSFYANGFYAGCITNNTDGNIIISTYTGDGLQGNWTFDNSANLVLAPTNGGAGGAGSGEAAKLRGTRKIVNGYTNSYAFSTVLAAGGTPTVAYTATDSSVQSVRVTFAVQGSANVWEQFDVVVVQTLPQGNVNFTVSNRVKASDTPDTVVTATWNGTAIEISLNLDASQTGGGWASFDAVEFGLMAG